MRKQILISLLSGCLIALSAQVTLADDIPTTTLQMSSILQKLQAQGYNNIQKIKFEDGQYEANVSDAQGQIKKLKIDPKTGKIINLSKETQTYITALEAVKKVEAAGYHNIYELKVDNEYEVKALDKEGNKKELEVNTKTGKVHTEGFD